MGNAGDILVYISAEDAVTKAVIERLLSFCSDRFKVFKEMPARGGKIKSMVSSLNKLALTKPVILLTDLDTADCAPQLKQKLLNNEIQSPDFIFNIAIDEAEAWLMADREGFSKFFKIPINLMPNSSLQKMGGMKAVSEMSFSIKSSMDLTHRLAAFSTDAEIRKQIEVNGSASKGKEYNSAVVPFIKSSWNIETAMSNSDSLARMVNRLILLESKF